MIIKVSKLPCNLETFGLWGLRVSGVVGRMGFKKEKKSEKEKNSEKKRPKKGQKICFTTYRGSENVWQKHINVEENINNWQMFVGKVDIRLEFC